MQGPQDNESKPTSQQTTLHSTMDATQQPNPTPPAPQIRSRITVVCAECKRLKLKCDRRTPCGSCTKRDTVARCIYSPAAAEKVDLHSLNNRLIQVEATLTLLTAGKAAPPFQSSYPLAQIAIPQSLNASVKPATSQPQPATATTPFSSISPSLHDITTIWLAHLDLDFDLKKSGTKKVDAQPGSNHIKLEPSPIDIHLSAPYTETPPSRDTPFVSLLSTHPQLPPLNVYYTSSQQCNVKGPPTYQSYAGSSTTPYVYPTANPYDFPPSTHTPSGAEAPPGAEPPHNRRPRISQQLLALLPSPSASTQLLQRARIAHPELSFLRYGDYWDRFAIMTSDPAQKERMREKDKKTELAHTLFYGRPPPSSPTSALSTPTIPLFAALCYLLALGAQADFESDVDHTLLYALAVQAISVWDDFKDRRDAGQVVESHGDENTGHADVVCPSDDEDEESEMDYLVAGLLQVKCLIRAGSPPPISATSDPSSSPSSLSLSAMGMNADISTPEKEAPKATGDSMKDESTAPKVNWGERGNKHLEAVFPSVGRLVNVARAMGLARDPDESDSDDQELKPSIIRRRKKQDEWKRMVWWEIAFYDTFISDALNQPSLLSPTSYTTRLPNCSLQTPSSSNCSPSVSRAGSRPYTDVDGDDELDDDDSDFEPQFLPWNGPGRTNGRSSNKPVKASIKRKGKAVASRDDEDLYFSVRCRLTRLVQNVKHRLANPGCDSCHCGGASGYTLDQAVRIESKIRAFVADLPPSFSSLTSHGSDANIKMTKNTLLAAELAIMAHRLIICVYLPFLRPIISRPNSNSSNSSLSSVYTAHPWSPASRATVDAAQWIIRSVRLLLEAQSTINEKPGVRMMMADYYPIEKAILDAIVICAHSGFGGIKGQQRGSPYGKMMGKTQGKGLIEDVNAGLELMASFGVPSTGKVTGEYGRILELLRRKLNGLRYPSGVPAADATQAENALKRKRDQVDNTRDRGGEATEEQVTFMGADTEGMLLDFEVSLSQNDAASSRDSVQPPPHIPMAHGPPIQHPQPQPPPPPPIREVPSPASKVPDKEKEKKHSKKPVVGFRVRPGKETSVPSWMAKRVIAATANGSSPTRPADEAAPPPQPPSLLTSLPIHSKQDTATGFQPHPSSQSIQPVAQAPEPKSSTGSYRSRSSSIAQSVDYSSSYTNPDTGHVDMHAAQRRKFSIHDFGHQSQPQSYTSSPTTTLDTAAHAARNTPSFEAQHRYDQSAAASFDTSVNAETSYASSSNVYANQTAVMSSATSFASMSGTPSSTSSYSPAAILASHQQSPSTFGSGQALTTSPQSYFHVPSTFNPFDNQGQHSMPHYADATSMDTSSDNRGVVSGGMISSIPSTPVYEKPQSPYDVKPVIDAIAPQHLHPAHFHAAANQDAMHQALGQNPHAMSASSGHSWAPTAQQVHVPPVVDHHGQQQFWNVNPEYKFYG